MEQTLEPTVVQHALFADMEVDLLELPKPKRKKKVWPHLADDPPARKPRWKEGDCSHRCFWCQEWSVHGPLQTCTDCKKRYQEAAIGMPPFGPNDE